MTESAPSTEDRGLAPESAPAEETPLDPAAALAAELAELKNRHLRLQAEFENFRKRKTREADDIRQYAAASILEAIIPVLDHLDIALDPSHDRSDAQWSQGIDLIARHLVEILRGAGLEEITAGRGTRFQHDVHQALASETADDLPSDHIIRVVRKGYKLRDRLLRPAHVIVSAEPADDSGTGSDESESGPSDSSREA